jgi:hypothetical protein
LNDLIREIKLDSGIVLTFYDKTSHYYGGFFHVSISVVCEIKLTPECCPVNINYEDAVSLLGDMVRYQKNLERMGVLREEVSSVKEHLIDQFIVSSQSYLADPNFPVKLVAKEIAKQSKNKSVNALRFS